MKLLKFFIVLYTLSFHIGYGQTYTGKIFELNELLSGSKTYKAQSCITLSPNFKYTPSSVEFFKGYIDKNLITENIYISADDDFYNRDLDKGLEVGSSAGIVNVSENGGATYTLPLALPKGSNNIAPSLAVNYNSQGGNGILGVGFQISGLSAITRSGQTISDDYVSKAVNLNYDDRFLLDGQRLKQANYSTDFTNPSSYGKNEVVYYTSVQSFSKTTSFGVNGGGPEWFMVETKEGLIYEYGKTKNSRFYPIDSSTPLSWNINRIYDENGNYVDFVYRKLDGELVIDKIKYTGNFNGVSPYNEVKFYYDFRKDKNAYFLKDKIIRSNVVLKEIEITVEGSISRRYNLEYTYSNQKSKLISIKERDHNRNSFNQTLFKYIKDEVEFSEYKTFSNLPKSAAYLPGDYNGDGRTDLIALNNSDDGGFKSYTYLVSDAYGQFSNYGTVDFPYTLYNGQVSSISSSISSSGSSVAGLRTSDYAIPNETSVVNNFSYSISDFNGDGKDDFVLSHRKFVEQTDDGGWFQSLVDYYTGTSYYYTSRTLYDEALIYISNGNTFSQPRKTSTYKVFDLPLFNTIKAKGDGSAQLLWHEAIDDKTSRFVIYDYQKDEKFELLGPSGFVFNNESKLIVLEADGDSDTEIMLVKDSGYEIFNVWQEIDGKYYAELISDGGFPSNAYEDIIKLGDFNGDGLSDLLVHNSSTNKWSMHHNRGTFFWEVESLGALTSNENNIYTIDIDSDGKSEVLYSTLNLDLGSTRSNFGTEFKVIYEYGLIFQDVLTESKSIYLNHYGTDRTFLSGDFNGDGKMDLFNQTYTGKTKEIYTFNKNINGSLLEEVIDGLNNSYNFHYKTLSQDGWYSNYIQDPISNTYQGNGPIVIDFQRPISVVTQFQKPNNGGGIDYTNYIYKGARFNRMGKGFLGFKVFRSNNNESNIETYIKKKPLYAYQTLVVHETESRRLDNNTLLSKTTNEFGSRTFAQDLYPYGTLNYIKKTTSIDYLKSSSTMSEFSYDSHANLTNTKITYSNGEQHSSVSQFEQKGTWIKSSPSFIQTTVTRPSYTGITKKSKFTYDLKGNITTKTDYANNTDQVNTEYTYDKHGNVIKSSYTSTDNTVIGKTSTIRYDSRGRFIVKRFNQNNEITNFSYHKETGQLIKKQKQDELLFSEYEIGPFGRVISTTSNTGTVKSKKKWGAALTNDGIYYTTEVSGDNIPSSKLHFGNLGQELKSEQNSYSGKITSTKKYRSDNGLLESSIAPHLTSGAILTTTISYDDLNRIESITTPLSSTTYAYSGFKTTVSSDNGTTSQTVDPLGRVIESKDEGGKIVYSYHPDGQVHKVHVNGGLMNEITYDEYGNQLTLMDANGGTSTYDYNIVGNLKSQIDAKSNEYNLDYNIDENLISKTDVTNAKTTNYDYYVDGVSGGLLKEIIGPDGVDENYEYDDKGRLIKSVEIIDGETFEYRYEYDDFGNLIKEVYPSGLALLNEYDQNGYKTKVRNEATGDVIWYLNIMNEKGQLGAYTMGNGIRSENEYDEYGFPVSSKAGSIQDLDYKFDQKTGNLISRKDHIKGLEEYFEYDDLDRLVESNVPSHIPLLLAYADNGNITQKTDAGTYVYSGSSPNAVKYVLQSSASEISELQQNIVYNSFNKAEQIQEDGYSLSFLYGNDNQRKKTILTDPAGQIVYTKYFSGSVEKIDFPNASDDILVEYISCGDGVNAIHVVKAGLDEIYYAYTDHLGSIMTVTDNTGGIITEQNFDAWGRYRDVSTWDHTDTPNVPNWLRGYTGHEHLPEFNLINMNGRLYDPLVGRMLSPDNYIQSAGYSQSYNRYSYALNNPLKYSDPSGNISQLAINVIIGGVSGGVQGYNIGKANGATGWGLVGYSAAGAGIGAGTAFLGAKIGGGAGSGLARQTLTGFATGAVGGASYAALAGENAFRGGLYGGLSGATGSFVSGGIGGRSGAVLGGAAGGATGAALRDSKDKSQILVSTFSGAAFGLLSFELNNHLAFKSYLKNAGANANLNKSGFRKVSTALQRSNTWEVEFGWYEMKNGNVKGVTTDFSSDNVRLKSISSVGGSSDISFEAHTHPKGSHGFEFAGPTDAFEYTTFDLSVNGAKVYSPENVYTINKSDIYPLRDYLENFGETPSWNEFYSYKDQQTKNEWYVFATRNGIANGRPHMVSFYINQIFNYGY